jgi:hypothetical protein
MATPPLDPWYNRYNRPYRGCGCLYAALILVLAWALVSMWIPGYRFF